MKESAVNSTYYTSENVLNSPVYLYTWHYRSASSRPCVVSYTKLHYQRYSGKGKGGQARFFQDDNRRTWGGSVRNTERLYKRSGG